MPPLVKNHLQCRRPGFNPWVGKIPWRRERLPTPVSWPGGFHGLYSPWGHKESDTTEPLSLSYFHFTSDEFLSEITFQALHFNSLVKTKKLPKVNQLLSLRL